jgi:chlorobactene glucosyltransferase
MMQAMSVWTWSLALLLMGSCGVTLWNLWFFKRQAPRAVGSPEADWPKISVCVPARDEAHNISACLSSYLEQDYPNLEVLVLDDNSQDGTWEQITSLQQRYPQLKAMQGQALAEGWMGKQWACHQLAQAAQGEYLHFADADTRCYKGAGRALVLAAQQGGFGMVSGLPKQVMDSFWPALGLPYLFTATFCVLPLQLARLSWVPLGMANGQCLFFSRQAYSACGGHTAVKDHIIEDMALARVCKQKGVPTAFLDLSALVECRMYGDFEEIWRGFSKNMYRLLNNSFLALLLVALATAVWVWPAFNWLWVSSQGAPEAWQQAALALYIASVLPPMLVALVFGHSKGMAFLHPLSSLFMSSILLNSVRQHFMGGFGWKGRTYKF